MDDRPPQLSRVGTYAVRRLVGAIAVGALFWWQGPAAIEAATGRDPSSLEIELPDRPDVPNPFDEVATALDGTSEVATPPTTALDDTSDVGSSLPTVTTDGPNPYGLAGEDLGRPAESPEQILAWRIFQRQNSGIVGDPETDEEAACIVSVSFDLLPEQARQVLGYYGRPNTETVELWIDALAQGEAACT